MDSSTEYCCSTIECNNWSKLSCWSPLVNRTVPCASTDWQCKVRMSIMKTFVFCCYYIFISNTNILIIVLLKSNFTKKTNITTGEGSCAQSGTSNSTTLYCSSGSDCNNFAGESCWDPIQNKTAENCT